MGSGNCPLLFLGSTQAFAAHHPSPDLTCTERLGPVGLVGYESFSKDFYSALSQSVEGPKGQGILGLLETEWSYGSLPLLKHSNPRGQRQRAYLCS